MNNDNNTTPSATAKSTALSNDDDLDAVYRLLAARAQGQATDDRLEAAVARVVCVAPAAGGRNAAVDDRKHGKSAANEKAEEDDNDDDDDDYDDDDNNDEEDDEEANGIEEDMGNYDDDDDAEETTGSKHPESSAPAENDSKRPYSTAAAAGSSDDDDGEDDAPVVKEPSGKRKRGRPRKEGSVKYPRRPKRPRPQIDFTPYQDVPYGKQGAQMLATFGDARRPAPETVRAALDAARVLVHAATADARRLRSRFLRDYGDVKRSLRSHRPERPRRRGEWSAELVYQAMVKNARHNSAAEGCFTTQELQILYPEELHVYDRWRLMKQKAEKQSKGGEDTAKSDAEEEEEDDDEEEKKFQEEKMKEFPASGHMAERCEQFDRRTDRMKKKRYLEFSEIRRGSFLGRVTKADPVEEDHAAAAAADAGKWARMASTYLKFLLWCGFDPQSSVPPPNEPTTEALAFLAYNFLGRVVEHAIRLRNETRKQRTGGVVEVPRGEQLEAVDIENAMKDPRVRQARIFDDDPDDDDPGNGVGTQLYFGPGFETRLELELEAMVDAARQKTKKTTGGKTPRATPTASDDLMAHLAAPDLSFGQKEQPKEDTESATQTTTEG